MKNKTRKPVEKLSNDLNELKAFMDYSVDVEHWNKKRNIAKGYFTPWVISQLDASGFINEGIKLMTNEEANKALNEVI